jgi:hypothetical protein
MVAGVDVTIHKLRHLLAEGVVLMIKANSLPNHDGCVEKAVSNNLLQVTPIPSEYQGS